MKSLRIAALAAAVASVTLVACGEDSPDSSGQATSTAAPTTTAAARRILHVDDGGADDHRAGRSPSALRGKTFASTAVEGYTLVPDTKVTLTFDGENLWPRAAATRFGGTWSVEGDVLVVPPMVRTMMACEPSALMDQETWLDAVLTSKPDRGRGRRHADDRRTGPP